jgi:membrane associated rhomboid family serine protease
MAGVLRDIDNFFSEHMPEVTRRLFYLCIAIYLVDFILRVVLSGAPGVLSLVDRVLVLTPRQAVLQGHLWQFLTYMFTHGSFGHLLGNMIGLFFFGGLIEREMGSRRYLWMMLVAGLMGGLMHTTLAFGLGRTGVGLVGFSGAVFALLTAAAMWFPHMRVLVMFVIPVPMRVLAIVFGVIMALGILEELRFGGLMGGSVSHMAHFGGVLAAVLLIRAPRVLDWLEDLYIPGITRRRPRRVRRISMGHPGRHSDPDDLYNDPHWYLDQ